MQRRAALAILGGAGFLWPFAAHAQQKTMPVIGMLSSTARDAALQDVEFRQGLKEAGYVEGQNVGIDYRSAEMTYDRLPALAADLVASKVDLIVTSGPPAALAAKRATSTIPIVFGLGSDPVALGLVASLSRPGGNLTGVSFLTVDVLPKLLELLSELVPQSGLIAVLVNPDNPNTQRNVADVQEASRTKARQLHILNAGTESDIDAAFTALVELHAGALVVVGDPFFTNRRDQFVVLASRYAVPAIYTFREFVEVGGLMSYGASIKAAYRQVGLYAGRVLKGDKPADLPVQQSSRIELVINLKTAKALGLTVPHSLLQRADEVIE